MSLIKRRLVAPTSGGDIERIKRIKAPDNMTLALGNQGGTAGGIAAEDFKIVSFGVSLDNQAQIQSNHQSVKTAITSLESSVNNLDGRMDTVESDKTTVDNTLSTINSNIGTLSSTVGDAAARLLFVEGSGYDPATMSVSGLSGSVSTLQANHNALSNLSAFFPRALRAGAIIAASGPPASNLLSCDPGTSSVSTALEKSHVVTTVNLTPGRNYQLNFGYNALANNYSALPGGAATSAPHATSTTASFCRKYYLICRVHRGTAYNNSANIYAQAGFFRNGQAATTATFYDANAGVTAVFRASTDSSVYPPASVPSNEAASLNNTYSIVFYVKNETFTGGSGFETPAQLKFGSLWYRLEEQPDVPTYFLA